LRVRNDSTQNSETLQSALMYARHGLPVIPLYGPGEKCKKPGKQPREEDWTHKGTTDEGAILCMSDQYPKTNFGTLTGRKSRLVIVDVDNRASFIKLTGKYVGIPDTVCVLTGRTDEEGSRHIQYYFRYPEGAEIKNGSNVFGHWGLPGIDIRGDGGQAVCAGSVHISGLRYEFEFLCSLAEVAISEMPGWLIDLLRQPKRADKATLPNDECESIPDGCRNTELTKIAGSLRRQGLEVNEMFDVLLKINERRCQPPLDDSELQTIASSVARYPVATVGAALDFSQDPAEWPDPLPINEKSLPPVGVLWPEMIPAPFKPWLMDISCRMQAPIDFVAAGAIVAASALIGSGCSIRPKRLDDWEVIPNLWGCVIGRPSMLKTPSLVEIMKPLSRLEADARQEYEDMTAFSEAEHAAYKAKRVAIEGNMAKAAKVGQELAPFQAQFVELKESPAPVRRRFKTNDSTVEKLGELLNASPRGLLVFRDELTGLMANWEREDRQGDRSFYLEGWGGGQSFTADRIGRGTIDIQNCCISILGSIQPSKLTDFLLHSATGSQNDGMIQRFQVMVFPNEPSCWELVDRKPDVGAIERAHRIFNALAEIDFVAAGASADDRRPFFRFDDVGQGVFYDWLANLEGAIRSEEHPLMTEHLAKYRSLMPSLALLFHLIEIADSGSPRPVSGEAAEMAVRWCVYLESHARRVYGLLTGGEEKAAAALAKKIKAGKVKTGFSARDVYRNHWAGLDSPDVVERACGELEELEWLRRGALDIPGRHPKIIYYVNPKIST